MDKKNSILLAIDCQNDFIDGSLAVSGAKDIMDALTRYVEKYGQNYKYIAFTMDQHPMNHCSFKDNGGEWPMHCVTYTEGAAIYDPLIQAAIKVKKENNDDVTLLFLEKGTKPSQEEYSAFVNDFNRFIFNKLIKEGEIEQIDIVGICGDYCTLETTKSLIEMGYKDKLNVMEEFCPSIDDGSTLHKFVEENNLKNER